MAMPWECVHISATGDGTHGKRYERRNEFHNTGDSRLRLQTKVEDIPVSG
jgi:hypothetical protein